MDTLRRIPAIKVSADKAETTSRVVPEEVPVALVYDGTTHAVMMATPDDLDDMALGFSLNEGQIKSAGDIAELSIVEQENGIELRMWLAPHASARFASRRRAMLGPTGCGLCGVDSLAAALPDLPRVTGSLTIAPDQITDALEALAAAQSLNHKARAVHAAAFWSPARGLEAIREDVGRHNALDKLAGALASAGNPTDAGVIVLTSRVSVEMVQKAAIIGAPIIVAVSAPTALAVKTAEACGITLAAIARGDSFEIFTHPHRIHTGPVKESRFVREPERHAEACR